MSASRGCDDSPKVLFCRDVRRGYFLKGTDKIVINPDLPAMEMLRTLARLLLGWRAAHRC